MPRSAARFSPCTPRAFTLVELLVAMAIIAVLSFLATAGYARIKHQALRTKCIANIKSLAAADILYYGDHGIFPAVEGLIPSTISAARLQAMGEYINMPVPEGKVSTWPRRAQQPDWYNCPAARESGYAEGMTAGGGVYTGYMYLGGLEESQLILSGMAKLTNPKHTAPRNNLRRGVLWCDILSEFRGAGERRFECFHSQRGVRHPDFRFEEREIEGMNRAWSDGSVEWLPRQQLNLSSKENLQIEHFMGNYYY
ncbi:prepilin-type N-terminal cleavage/methylation domain-containing protein [Phragmitibacter flavus]|uniref:Prepilin-type N-terminal cleavage/methylation domain-containing protein n=1 Tax=Phragmitibacter flavus TaxID=2576071 RepID=A0A5R8KB74_9BACT|nr:prepilin-type N-terminal cleavage/methylation domain-containing protein [Phragmitibacter flavus]TLD69175.1 prepilin-type N-terminal cleavage/methylation domain-containing protein [Phragmitibacter flavus]